MVDVDLVRSLLTHGSDPNQTIAVHNENLSVWVAFLNDRRNILRLRHVLSSERDTWYEAANLLTDYGGYKNCTVSETLPFLFGREKAAHLEERMAEVSGSQKIPIPVPVPDRTFWSRLGWK